MPSYRECSPGEGFIPLFFDVFKGEIRAGQSLIDFGCGTGRASKDFLNKGLNVTLVDISDYCLDEEIRNLCHVAGDQIRFLPACLWDLPSSLKPAAWIFCCDVLEHLPEECIEKALTQMAERMRRGGFFSICLKEDLSGKELNQPLHLTVKDASFWNQLMKKHFFIEKEALFADGLYYTVKVLAR